MPLKWVTTGASSDRRSSRSKGEQIARAHVGKLAGSAGYALERAKVALSGLFASSLDALSLTSQEFQALCVIDCHPGARLSDISPALGLRDASVVPVLKHLHLRELVSRSTNETDGRSYRYWLTDYGRERLGRALAAHKKIDRRVKAALGSQGAASFIEQCYAVVSVANRKRSGRE